MLQKLPGGMRRPGRLHTTEIDWESVDGGLEIEVRMMASDRVDKLLAELDRIIVFHHWSFIYDTPSAASGRWSFGRGHLFLATYANAHSTELLWIKPPEGVVEPHRVSPCHKVARTVRGDDKGTGSIAELGKAAAEPRFVVQGASQNHGRIGEGSKPGAKHWFVLRG